MKNEKVKPCPFCKSTDIRFSNKTMSGGRKRHVAMYCYSCNAYGPRTIIEVPVKIEKGLNGFERKAYYLTSEERETYGRTEAVEAWNRRQE